MAKENGLLSGLVKLLWFGLIAGILVLAAIFVYISKTQMPDTEELENPNYDYATIIYSEDYEEIGRYYKVNRDWVTFENLNPKIVEALIATEDERFYSHNGIDFRSLTRAVLFLGKKGGASTITQQLAKQFFTNYSRSFIKRLWQKFTEWAISIQFERRYTKGEILAMYMNKFEFIHGAYGIQAAAQTYFGKNQKELNVQEAATLVGMLKNPVLYNPKGAPERSEQRRNVVLRQMVRNNYLTEEEYDKVKDEALDISKFKKDVHYEGPAPYFRSTLTTYLKRLLDEDQYKKPDGTKYNIYKDGLKIYTTLDLTMQEYAEDAMKEHMTIVQNRYFDVWDDKNPWTFEATDYQKDIRSQSLDRMVRESERFLNLRSKVCGKAIKDVLTHFPEARLWDTDIMRMKKAESDANYIQKLLSENIIRRDQANRYREIMKSPEWKPLINAWNELNGKAKTAFNRKVNMSVFDYSDSGEKAVSMTPLDSIKYHRMHMQLGSVSIDPKTGYVKTWVGGIGNKYFKYDHVTSNRQVGSTFKPFIYATAIFQQGMSPCQKVQDIQYTIPANDANFGLMESWSPSNSRGTFTGKYVTLKEGLKNSLNSVSIWLMKQLGNTEVVRDFVDILGIDKKKIPNAPSICLGSADLNVLEMTSAYCAFANDGQFNKPIFVKKIEDANGKPIYTAVPETRRAIPSAYNYAMVDLLKYAGSAISWQLDTELGGKTGTTNDYVDGWFMGITPNLVTGTWVGGEDPWIRFLSLDNGQGGKMARPYFVELMKKVENDKTGINWDKEATFVVPEDGNIEVDCSKYEQIIIDAAKKDSVETNKMKKVKVFDEEFEEEFDEEFGGN